MDFTSHACNQLFCLHFEGSIISEVQCCMNLSGYFHERNTIVGELQILRSWKIIIYLLGSFALHTCIGSFAVVSSHPMQLIGYWST